MEITLESLAAKTLKSNADISISDHTITFLKPTQLIITGNGVRGLVFNQTKNCEIIFRNCILKNGSTGVTIKFNGNFQDSSVKLENSQIYAKPGGSGSQVIYWEGEFNKNIYLEMDTTSFVDGGRTEIAGNTAGGAAIQVASSYTARCNASNWSNGTWSSKGVNVRNANDEAKYLGYYAMQVKDVVYLPTGFDAVLIDAMEVDGSGREYIQITNAKYVWIGKLKGRRGSLEKHNDHWSGISINGGCPEVLIEDCDIAGVAQPIYFGTYGVSGKSFIQRCRLEQRKDYYAPSAVYLKGPVKHSIEDCTIIAVQNAITVDKAELTYKNVTTQSPNLIRNFNSPTPVELPYIREHQETLTVRETTIGGVTTTQYILPNGTELKP